MLKAVALYRRVRVGVNWRTVEKRSIVWVGVSWDSREGGGGPGLGSSEEGGC